MSTLAEHELDKYGRNSYFISMKTIVSEKGQITIPKPLRARLGLRTGQVLDVQERSGRLVLTKEDLHDPVDRVYGILKQGRSTDEIMDKLRGGEKPR